MKVTSKFHAKDPQILGATIQNLVTAAPLCVHACDGGGGGGGGGGLGDSCSSSA
jgi:hypothetical protein